MQKFLFLYYNSIFVILSIFFLVFNNSFGILYNLQKYYCALEFAYCFAKIYRNCTKNILFFAFYADILFDIQDESCYNASIFYFQ